MSAIISNTFSDKPCQPSLFHFPMENIRAFRSVFLPPFLPPLLVPSPSLLLRIFRPSPIFRHRLHSTRRKSLDQDKLNPQINCLVTSQRLGCKRGCRIKVYLHTNLSWCRPSSRMSTSNWAVSKQVLPRLCFVLASSAFIRPHDPPIM